METEVERKTERRPDLATQLLNRLKKFKGKKPLIVATSTSSIELAKKIARELHGEYHHALVKKLIDPENSMKVIGAVTEWAGVYLTQDALNRGLDPVKLEDQIHPKIEEMQMYRLKHPMHANPEKRAMIFIDTGSRTGYRLAAVLMSVKKFLPLISVVATPDITHRAFALINNMVDDVIALKVR
ncbi:MAG: hypothetical protein ABL958_06205 [Bdellovibrionia bacterium]